LHLI
jgi:hypothetical protein